MRMKMNDRIMAVAILAVFVLAVSAAYAYSSDSDAAIDATGLEVEGTATLTISPGGVLNWSPDLPSDLTVKLEIEQVEPGITASISENEKTVIATPSNTAVSGQSYDVLVKATSTNGGEQVL